MTIIPIHQRGYTHPELLAQTDWLAEHLDDPNVRIVDARPPQQYAAGHIPGAVNLSGFGGIPRAANGDMARPEDFARVAGSLGIGTDMTIVVYDAPSQMMGMVTWAFLYYGHQDVRLLDGGYHKWTHEGDQSLLKQQAILRPSSMPNPLRKYIARLPVQRLPMVVPRLCSGIREA